MTNESSYKNPMVWELLSWAMVVTLFILPAIYYADLPDQIPSHFNAKGEPDAYSKKTFIWVLPILGLALFLFLNFLSHMKNLKVNTPRQLSPEQEEEQRLIGRKMLHALKLAISIMFVYIMYHTIQTAQGQVSGLSKYFIWVTVAGLFSVIGYFMVQSYRALDK